MKRLSIFLCICVCTVMVSAQTSFVLKHQKDTTVSLKLKPYKYSHKKCDTIDLELTLVFDQLTETINANVNNKRQSNYNLIWIPPKDNGFLLTNLGKFQKDFKNKYYVKISLNSHLKKQIKELKITELYPITYRNCDFLGYSVPDTVKCKAKGLKEKQSRLQNEMFDINIMDSMNITLSMSYKVLNKANVVDLRFFGFVPVISKGKSSSKIKKLELQYIADGPLINIKLHRDPCVDEIKALNDVDSIIENLKSIYTDLERARTEKNKKECDQIKSRVSAQDKNLNISGVYGNSLCNTLLSNIEEYHSWVEKILKYSDGMTCLLDPSELNQAAVKINKLVTKWDIDKKTDVGEIDNIIKNLSSKINKYSAFCRNNKKVQDALESYNGAVDFYHIKIKK
jgi:hypothetical protein